ncbi:hypothetical protein BJX70DRAFT_353064 [Aspergillus crustosus]
MGKGDRDPPTKTNTDRFLTPDKPASASKLKRAPARLGLFPDTPGTISTSNSTPSTTSASKSSKRNSSRSVQDQPTLTQIDFVTVSQQAESGDEFDYIGNTGKHAREVIEIEDEDEEEPDNNVDEDYKPSSIIRSKRARGVRFDTSPPKPHQNSSSGEGKQRKRRRKSGEKTEKGAHKDDKTLTQMNYVRRIVIEPDEVVKLEYAYITPKKKEYQRQSANAHTVEHVQQTSTYTPEPSNDFKRRKLSPTPEAKEVHDARGSTVAEAALNFSTPMKSLRTEIPSSQSPESPSVASITSSQFRCETRPSQNPKHANAYGRCIKEELPGSPELVDAVMSPLGIENKPSHQDLDSLGSSSDQRKTAQSIPPAGKETSKYAGEVLADQSNLINRPHPAQRTVVYETDADSDGDDYEDCLPDVPSSPGDRDTTGPNEELPSNNVPNTQTTESQELPPLPVPEQESDSVPLPPEPNILSDASICYQRVHPATQFPLEPVPTINTQKMAELFPEDSNGLLTLSSLSQPSSPMKTPRAHPRTVSQTLDPDQTQSDPHDIDKTAADVVPESSPIFACHGEDAMLNRRVSATDAVVQVESSQRVDRIQRHNKTGQNSGRRRGVLSRSQILTSSVMESIPIPAFWKSSQDSVGEPYSMPDTTSP